MAQLGMDCDTMEPFPQRFAELGETFKTQWNQLYSQFANVTWTGPDEMGFRPAFKGSLDGLLARVQEDMNTFTSQLRQHITEQRNASGTGSAG